MKKLDVIIEKAQTKDSVKLSKFIEKESFVDSVLRRSPEEIAQYDYFIALYDNQVIGTIGYKIWEKDGPEIISHVVKTEFRGKSIGYKLIQKCMEKIRSKGYKTVFALVIAPKLFQKFGFYEIKKNALSCKARIDCRNCKKNLGDWNDPICSEIALRLDLG
ncbi:MAG: GNAT family N-acetyltransferase [Patescibacteria group bacterium]